jgi:hypothetical protein
MSRFNHPPPSAPDIAGAVKEAIGEVLYRRAHQPIALTDNLLALNIMKGDVVDVVELTLRSLAGEVAFRPGAFDPSKPETVADLIAAIERAAILPDRA